MIQLNKKLILAGCLIVISVTAAVSVVFHTGYLQRIESYTYDWRMKQFRADRQLPDDVAVILIDEASLKTMNSTLGRWPWPRSVYGEVMDFLRLGNPKAIVFDILFVENQKSIDQAKNTLSLDDARLVEATRENKIIYHAMQIRHDDKDEIDNKSLNTLLPSDYKRFNLNRYKMVSSENKNNIFHIPFDGLYQASKGVGAVDALADSDGVYRRTYLLREYQNNIFPSLSITPILDSLNIKKVRLEEGFLWIDDKAVPLTKDKTYMVNFYGKSKPFSMAGILKSAEYIKAGDLEKMIVDPYEFEDKIVFIGVSAMGAQDVKNTPLSNKTPGVMIHASVVGNILTHDFLSPPNNKLTTLLIILFALLTTLCVFTFKHVVAKVVLPLALGSAYFTWSLIQFSQNIVLDLIAPQISIVLACAGAFTYLVFTEGKEKRKVRTMLSQYVSPAILKAVVDKHDDQIQAEVGRSEEVSVLFSDIRGFTGLSEVMDAGKLVKMLNYYFTEMTDTIFEFDGTVDKFIGDAIMAFWGAPIKTPDHAKKSTLAAIDMNTRLDKVNQWLLAEGYQTIGVGIGINSGEVIIGNIGSDKKLDYTVIGDNVNLASRLEGLTKTYKSKIVISEYTYEQLNEEILCRTVDLVRVKGKEIPIKIYSPIVSSDGDGHTMNYEEIVEQTNQAFDAYLNRDWQGSIDLYSAMTKDGLGSVFMKRCKSFLKQEPPEDWDGVFTMTTK